MLAVGAGVVLVYGAAAYVLMAGIFGIWGPLGALIAMVILAAAAYKFGYKEGLSQVGAKATTRVGSKPLNTTGRSSTARTEDDTQRRAIGCDDRPCQRAFGFLAFALSKPHSGCYSFC